MPKYKERGVIFCMALAMTLASLAVARQGQPYYCSQGLKYPELRRDERGIPLSFIMRSVQGTGCSPKDMNDRAFTYEEEYHRIQYVSFMADLVFWYGVFVAVNLVLKKLHKDH